MNEEGGLSPLDAFAINIVTKNLLTYIRQFTPVEIATWFKQGKDMSEMIDFGPLAIPNFGLSLKAVRRYMASRDELFFEAVRLRMGACEECNDPVTGEWSLPIHEQRARRGLCPFLPVHAKLLGKDSVLPWYLENMTRVRDRLIADLDAAMSEKGAGKKHERHGQDGGDSRVDIGADHRRNHGGIHADQAIQ